MERHRFDPLSFSFGVIYTVVGLLFLIPATTEDLIPLVVDSARWLWPLVVLGLGVAIIAPLARRREDMDESETVART